MFVLHFYEPSMHGKILSKVADGTTNIEQSTGAGQIIDDKIDEQL